MVITDVRYTGSARDQVIITDDAGLTIWAPMMAAAEPATITDGPTREAVVEWIASGNAITAA